MRSVAASPLSVRIHDRRCRLYPQLGRVEELRQYNSCVVRFQSPWAPQRPYPRTWSYAGQLQMMLDELFIIKMV